MSDTALEIDVAGWVDRAKDDAAHRPCPRRLLDDAQMRSAALSRKTMDAAQVSFVDMQ